MKTSYVHAPFSILLGLPLSVNMMWHLQVANDNSGRGVLRLIRLHNYINLLCVPMICADLFILALPTEQLPLLMCGVLVMTFNQLYFIVLSYSLCIFSPK